MDLEISSRLDSLTFAIQMHLWAQLYEWWRFKKVLIPEDYILTIIEDELTRPDGLARYVAMDCAEAQRLAGVAGVA